MVVKKNVLILPTKYKKGIFNAAVWFCYTVVATFLLFYIKGNEWSSVRRILLLFVYIFPAIFISTKIVDVDKINRYSDAWLKVLTDSMSVDVHILDLRQTFR